MNLGRWTYFVWLVGCVGPILVGQWALFSRILRPQRGAIFAAAATVGTYLTVVDHLAIGDAVWEFSPWLILGIRFGSVPLEETLFFLLTALVVAQSMTLFTYRGRLARPKV